MNVFIDESGDPGMKSKIGSSPHFTVAAVWMLCPEVEKSCRSHIKELKQQLGWSSRQEFKFNKVDNGIKEQFFQTVAQHDFRFMAVVLNKALLTGPGFQYAEPFQKYAIKLLLTNAAPYFDPHSTVVMDQCGGRDFRRTMDAYVRRSVPDHDGTKPIAKVRTEKSHACELVQMADMICGAVSRAFRIDRSDHKKWRGMIAKHEIDVHFWPKIKSK